MPKQRQRTAAGDGDGDVAPIDVREYFGKTRAAILATRTLSFSETAALVQERGTQCIRRWGLYLELLHPHPRPAAPNQSGADTHATFTVLATEREKKNLSHNGTLRKRRKESASPMAAERESILSSQPT